MRFGLRSPKILFDANAVRDFFRDRGLDAAVREQLRARLEELVSRGNIRIVLTQPILWELASIVDDADGGGWASYEAAVRFYVAVSHGWPMRHEYERYELELSVRRPLHDDEVFRAVDREQLLSECLTEDWVRQRRSQLQKAKQDEREKEAASRLAAVAALERRDPRWREMFSDRHFGKTVSAGVKRELRAFARQKGLHLRGPQWPHPRSAPTFWFSECFWLAKARRVFLENATRDLTSRTSLKDVPDLVDATHFRDAAYADVLVTRDRRLSEVGRAAGVPIQIVTFAEFARELTLV